MRWSPLFAVPAVLALLMNQTEAQAQKPAPVSFIKQVAPILLKKCMACHGERQPKSGYQLYTFEKMLQEGDFGEPLVTTPSAGPGTQIRAVNAAVVPPRDPDTMASALAALLGDDAERARMARSSRDIFDYLPTHADMVAGYRRLLWSAWHAGPPVT